MQDRPGRPEVVVPLIDVDPTAVSDAHLAQAWAARDPLALGEVYRRFAATLFGAAACLLDDRAAAADAVHDGLVRAAARVGGLRAPARLRVWLLAIVRNEAASRPAGPGRAPYAQPAPAVPGPLVPALPPAMWRLDGVPSGALLGLTADVSGPGADALRETEAAWAASAALAERDREVLELSMRGVTDTRDLADVLGVSAQQAAMLVADMRVRLEAALGALLVARQGRADCPGLAAVLEGQADRWTGTVLDLVGGHLRDCPDCRALRARLAPAGPLPLAGPRAVPLQGDLRARLVATLGADGSAVEPVAAVEGVRRSSWLVDAPPAGVGGRGWGWEDDGFPTQSPAPVRRVADAEAQVALAVETRAADEAARRAALAPALPAPRRRRPSMLAVSLLLGVPLVAGGTLLAGGLGVGPGAGPSVVGGSATDGPVPGGAVVTGADGRTRRAGTGGPVVTTGPDGTVRTVAGPPAGPDAASAVDGEASAGAPAGTASGPGGGTSTGGPDGRPTGGTTTPPRGSSSSSAPPSGSSSSSSSSTSPDPDPPSTAPVITGVSVSPATVEIPGAKGCDPLRSTVTVSVNDLSGVTGYVVWSIDDRTTQRAALARSGGVLKGAVGPFRTVGAHTLTITVKSTKGSDTATRSLDVVACGRAEA